MSISDGFKRWLRDFGKFLRLAQGAAAALAVLGGFLWVPSDYLTDQKAFAGFARFLLCILVLIMFVIAMKYRHGKHAGRWLMATSASLVVFVLVFFWYYAAWQQWTCECASCPNERVVIGSRYTEAAETYIRKHGPLSCEDLLPKFGYKTKRIWVCDTMIARRVKLLSAYTALVALVAVCAMAGFQAAYCARGKKT